MSSRSATCEQGAHEHEHEAAGGVVHPAPVLAAAADEVDRLGSALWQVGDRELAALMTQVDDLARRCAALRVTITVEALERGVVPAKHAPEWVAEHAPSLRASGARALACAVQETASPDLAPARSALLTGDLSVREARVVTAELARMRDRLVPGAAPAVCQGLVDLAPHGIAQMRRLRPALFARYGMSVDLERREAKAQGHRALSAGHEAEDGVSEYRLLLDPEGRAVLEAALAPLVEPRPVEGERDLRSHERRRADALLELVGRAVASAAGPRQSRCQLVLTMTLDDLVSGRGAASTLGGFDTGDRLSAAAARRLACDAGILPAVLGGEGEVLDLGREQRLFHGAALTALWLRDQHCTYRGCTMPAKACQAHHLLHWLDGGPTDQRNGALLCERHHHLVHSRRLHGWVDPDTGVVRWDPTNGSYDIVLARGRAPASAGRRAG